MKSRVASIAVFVVLIFVMNSVQAYPEYQAAIVKMSHRPVNCAMCHVHGDGPEGAAVGQIGRLTTEEFARLGRARAAFEPGGNVNSPILNAFGNHIINSIGKTKFIELRQLPEKLPELLPAESDLDGDGIPNIQEYRDGTNPLNKNDGSPLLLFKINLERNIPQIALAVAATFAGLYGFKHILRSFATALRRPEEHDDENDNPK
jgi:hypothetical protein